MERTLLPVAVDLDLVFVLDPGCVSRTLLSDAVDLDSDVDLDLDPDPAACILLLQFSHCSDDPGCMVVKVVQKHERRRPDGLRRCFNSIYLLYHTA